MSRSVLLQLARDSIEEVFQAQSTINKNELLQTYPLLQEKIKTNINLYINGEIKGSYTNKTAENSLLANIIIGAKKAAFEDTNRATLTTSEYLHCELEIILFTSQGNLKERDSAIIKSN